MSRRTQILILVAVTPLTGFVGLLAGAVIVMVLGGSFYGGYELAPEWLNWTVGVGSALAGLAFPWVLAYLARIGETGTPADRPRD